MGRSGTLAVTIAFVVSGLTSYVTLVVTKRSLSAEDFGLFSLFWSLGFFAAAVSSVPIEQELARSLAVQLERKRSPWHDIRAAAKSAGVATSLTIAACVTAFFAGFFGTDIGVGVAGAFAALVVGEAIAALGRAEMAARRDTVGLVGIVGGHGIARVVAATFAAVGTDSLAVACGAVAASGLVPAAFMPRVLRRRHDVRRGATRSDLNPGSDAEIEPSALHDEFSHRGVRRLLVATPPRALFAIGTPVLAAVIAGENETAQIGDVLAALSLTSAPVLVAAALQVTLLPQFASWVERGDHGLIRSRMLMIIAVVTLGGAIATVMTALVGVRVLELLFGSTPGVGTAALSLMTAGAALLFLANLLVPVSIAVRDYTMVTTAWMLGALALMLVALRSDAVAFGVGRALVVGAAVVNGVLLWGLRPVWMSTRRPSPTREPQPTAGIEE